jgi:hypothetical protein
MAGGWDGTFFGITYRITTASPEELEWHRKFEAAMPVRPDGWTRYLCLPDSSIIIQVGD